MHDLPTPKPFIHFVKTKRLPIGAIIKIPPKVAEDSYKDLICTDADIRNIHKLIMTMAETGKIDLWLYHQTDLRGIGVAIESVHPLKFLSVVFGNPQLKAAMPKIFEDYFKRTEFVEGLVPSLMRQLEKGKLLPFVADFAKEINVPEKEIQPYFQNLNWEGLIRYLMGGV